MLPNVRLMIAATLASVVALICGFGMFAVFRVSHDPFARLPAATAPLQLVAGNAAKSAAGLASGEPFDRRFQVKASPNAATEASAAPAASEPRAEPEAAVYEVGSGHYTFRSSAKGLRPADPRPTPE